MIPPKIVERHRSKFSGVLWYGVPIIELSKDELMAMVCQLSEMQERARLRYQQDIVFLAGEEDDN